MYLIIFLIYKKMQKGGRKLALWYKINNNYLIIIYEIAILFLLEYTFILTTYVTKTIVFDAVTL